jgi:dGTP triphosphohydrolase
LDPRVREDDGFKVSGSGEQVWLRELTQQLLYRRRQRRFFDIHQISAFMQDPVLLPPDYQVSGGDVSRQARKISDYIAGMTDRYAIREHRRIFSIDEL